MFKIKTIIITTCFTFFIGGLASAGDIQQEDAILAQVGSSSLTASYFSRMIGLMQPQAQVMFHSNPDMRKELINRWIEINLMAQEALATQLDKDPQVSIKMDEMKNRILVEALINKRIDTQSPIAEDALTSYYNKHGDEFTIGEQIQVQHILIRVDPAANNEEKQKAKKTIDMISQELARGESFSNLARMYSEDPGSQKNGGDLGYFVRGQMVKEFEEAAFTTAQGETSAPVLTHFGWHLIHVTDRKPPEKLAFDKVSKQIETKLKGERNEKALTELIEELKKKYPVSVK